MSGMGLHVRAPFFFKGPTSIRGPFVKIFEEEIQYVAPFFLMNAGNEGSEKGVESTTHQSFLFLFH